MGAYPVAIAATGLVTSVGLSSPASCAAIRAKVSNPVETRFMDSAGEWINAHKVPLERAWCGIARLREMAVMAISEALFEVPRDGWSSIPLLLCVAENERPGRLAEVDSQLLPGIEKALEVRFAPQSAVIPQGRTAIALALANARAMIYRQVVPEVVIAAVDSLLAPLTLAEYDRHGRLLTRRNSDGFMPGEGAGALRVAKPTGQPQLVCAGIGMGTEPAPIDSGQPLRADGLTEAIKAALDDAGCTIGDMDFRITDLSGEQYYFKEAALALIRTLRQRRQAFDLWHPAECTGESGALAGAAICVVADAACRKAYGSGNGILAHMANDNGTRAALALRFGVP